MNNQNLKLLSELLEQTTNAAMQLTNSQIAMEDGDISACQKHTKEAQVLLRTMVKDIFIEFKETYTLTSGNLSDYDLPNTLELIKQLLAIANCASTLLSSELDTALSKLKASLANKTCVAINTATDIYMQMFEN